MSCKSKKLTVSLFYGFSIQILSHLKIKLAAPVPDTSPPKHPLSTR